MVAERGGGEVREAGSGDRAGGVLLERDSWPPLLLLLLFVLVVFAGSVGALPLSVVRWFCINQATYKKNDIYITKAQLKKTKRKRVTKKKNENSNFKNSKRNIRVNKEKVRRREGSM